MSTQIIPEINTKTVAGAEYVRKITHPPPMTSSNSYHGRPDVSAGNVVLFELKGETNLPMVFQRPTSATTVQDINPGRAMLLAGSGNFAAAYLFYFDRGAWVQPQSTVVTTTGTPIVNQLAPPACVNSGYNFVNWAADVASHRTTYKSQTAYLNATGNNNQGTVTSAKFKPDIIVSSTGQLLESMSDTDLRTFFNVFLTVAPSDFRAAHARLQQHKSPRDEEYVHVGAERSPVSDIRKLFATFTYTVQFLRLGRGAGTITLLPNSLNMWAVNGIMPETMSDLLMTSPKAVTRPAVEGDFLVHQQISETMPWQDCIDTAANSPSGSAVPGLVFSFLAYSNNTSGNVYAPLYSYPQTAAVATQTNTSLTVDTQWNNLDWSYTIFDGLTVPNALSTSLTGGPYLTLKTFVGFEVQPQPYSSLLPFQKSLPLPDPGAIEMAAGIMHARPDSLPASANDLASIASVALKMLPTAVSWLKDLFGDKSSKDRALNKARTFVRPPPKPQRSIQSPRPARQTRVNFGRGPLIVPAGTSVAPAYQNQTIDYTRPNSARQTRAPSAAQSQRSTPGARVSGISTPINARTLSAALGMLKLKRGKQSTPPISRRR